jgi:hypothetical protein
MADKGILAASAKLAQSQIPTDVAGEFMKTFSAGVEAYEKEKAGIQNEVATWMRSLKTDIDFTSLSPEMEKATREFLTQGKNEFNELANKVARIKDPSSEEYQNAVDRMNEIQREFTTLAGELSSYNQEKINTAANFDANAYSKGVANKDLIVHKNIYGLSEAGMAPVSIQKGHLNFNVDGELVRYDKVQGLAMPSEIPVKIVEKAATFSGYNRALTEQEVNAQSIYLDESLKDSATLASVLFDYQTELPFPEIQKEFLEARENGTLEEKLPDLIARTKNIILTGFQDAALEGKAAYDARIAADKPSDTPDISFSASSYVNPKGSNYKQPIPGRVAGESWVWDESRNGYVYVETVGGENFPTGPSNPKGGKTVAYTNINTIEGYAKRGLR